jgi:hypothetical protein
MKYDISTDKSLIDIKRVKTLLETTYWAKERTVNDIIKSIKNSECVGVYE